MLQMIFNKITREQKIKLLIYHMLKILKKKNKSFHSCFSLKLPSNGMVSEKEFIRLLKKFLTKIQANHLYVSVFEVDDITKQLQVKILISAIYSKGQIEAFHNLWQRFLLKEHGFLKLNDVENCFEFRAVITTVEFLNNLFRLENSKDQIPFRLGTHDLGKKKLKCNKYTRYPGVFYGSGVFSAILQKFRILLVQDHSEAIEKRSWLRYLASQTKSNG
jgi:Ca2+-binding EF-hand superfamily protein